MRGLVLVITLLGGVLPLAALLRAAWVTRRAYNAFDRDLERIPAIAADHPEPHEATPLMYAVRTSTATHTTTLYELEEIQRAILRAAIDDLKGSALLAAIGVALSTIGSIWSLYL